MPEKHSIMEEDHVVLVDEKGYNLINPDGSIQTASKTEAHARALRHRAISVFVFNNACELLLQRRAAGKYHSGGLWSNTCCSHPLPGESPAGAAHRRLWEEMRIVCPLQEVYQFLYVGEVGDGLYEHEYDHVFIGWSEAAPIPNPDEVSSWKWMDCDDLSESLLSEPEKYTYWLKRCFTDVMERVSATEHEREQAH
jgi:isopentenyl-diphosphate delta-isomerase